VVGFAQQEGKAKGWAYLVVLVAGEGAEEDLVAWRVGRQRRTPSRRRRRRHERKRGERESAARTLGVMEEDRAALQHTATDRSGE